MIACTMRLEESGGVRLLTGVLDYALERGAIIALRKIEGEYCLIALSGNGRRIDCSKETLLSFVDTEVPCGWCPGREKKNRAVWIVGHGGKYFLCEECVAFDQFKRYRHRAKIIT